MDAKKSNTIENTADREISITRVLNAPRELVWEAFTDPKQVVKWWGPRGFTDTIEVMDLRVGGIWKHVMHGPDGANYPNQSTFVEITKPERIVYSHAGHKEDGPGAAFEASWTFEAQGNKTKVTGRMVFPSAAKRDAVVKNFNAVEGAQQNMSRLEEYLGTNPEDKPFILSRTFNAPRALLWKCFTEPERMKQWWGPKGVKAKVSNMDFRVGGIYHYCLQTPDGKDMWGKQVFRHIAPPEQIILINSFSDEKAGLTRHPMNPNWPIELLTTFTFTEKDGKTTFTVRWDPFNATETERKTFNEGHASMTQGWGGTLDQLGEYLPKAAV